MRAEPGANGADLGTKHELLMFFPVKARISPTSHFLSFIHFFLPRGSLARVLT